MIKVQVLIHDISTLLKIQLNVYCIDRDSSLRDFYTMTLDKTSGIFEKFQKKVGNFKVFKDFSIFFCLSNAKKLFQKMIC